MIRKLIPTLLLIASAAIATLAVADEATQNAAEMQSAPAMQLDRQMDKSQHQTRMRHDERMKHHGFHRHHHKMLPRHMHPDQQGNMHEPPPVEMPAPANHPLKISK